MTTRSLPTPQTFSTFAAPGNQGLLSQLFAATPLYIFVAALRAALKAAKR